MTEQGTLPQIFSEALMKLGLAQVNYGGGFREEPCADSHGLRTWGKPSGAELVVAPELAITGIRPAICCSRAGSSRAIWRR